MLIEIGHSLSSEREDVQAKWLSAEGLNEKVATVVGMDVREISPDALREMSLSLKNMVCTVEENCALQTQQQRHGRYM